MKLKSLILFLSFAIAFVHSSKGDRSLVIAFDGTASMQKDLEQLRRAAIKITNDLTAQEKNQIANYILVVFRDPEIEEPFVTSDPSQLIEKLGKINTFGGDDCPELSLSGLESGIKLAKQKSFAFIFTDANAKDYNKQDEIIKLIKEKEISVNVFITARCDDRDLPPIGIEVYHNITKYGHGQVFNVSRTDISAAVSTFMIPMRVDYDTILEANVDLPTLQIYTIYPDVTMNKILITVTGNRPKVTIRDPHNQIVEINLTLNLPNVFAGVIENPIKGKYTVKVIAKSPYSVRIGAETQHHFDVEFSKNETEEFDENVAKKVTIQVKNPSDLNNLTKVIVSSKNPDESTYVFESVLVKINETTYETEEIIFPSSSFEIFVEGVDKTGDTFKRMIRAVVKESESGKETILKKQAHEVIEGGVISLNCNANVSHDTKMFWKFNGKILSDDTSNSTKLFIINVTQANSGKYECNINGSGIEARKEYNIRVVAAPKLELIDNFNELKEGDDVTLKCSYQSFKNVTLTWIDENDKVLLVNNQHYTFKVPKNIKDKKISCKVKNEDFKAEMGVNFESSTRPIESSLDQTIDCKIDEKKILKSIGKVNTCIVKTFPSTGDALSVNFLNGKFNPKDITAISISSISLGKFPRNLKDIFPNLIAIDLINVNLTKITLDDLKPYRNLIYLNVSNNKITTLDGDVLKNNPDLKYVDFSHNIISKISPDFTEFLINGNFEGISFEGNGCVDDAASSEAEIKNLLNKISGDCHRNYQTLVIYNKIKEMSCDCCEKPENIFDLSALEVKR